MLKLDLDMSAYTDVELEVFSKELNRALNHMNHLTEPTEEDSIFELDITKNVIFAGYTESTRKSLERLIETITTEQTLRNTLKEEMIKKLDAYTVSELADLLFNVQNEVAHQRDIISRLSEEDGTNFKRDIEDFIEKQENYITLLTDAIKRRAPESTTTEPTTEPTTSVPSVGMSLGSTYNG